MPPLVEALDRACPGYVPDEGEADLPYIWMSRFVRHVIRARLEGAEDQIRAVFAVIEKAIAGNGADRELAIIGFLEDLQNSNLHAEGSLPEQFEAYLGPQSRKKWIELGGFWHAVIATKQQP